MTIDIIYVVWGPTAEWGDGVGPLGYFPSRTEAESFIADEDASVHDAGMADAWPYNQVSYNIHETSPDELFATVGLKPHEIPDEDELFEWLNTR